MNLLMLSGDQTIVQGQQGPFWYTLQELAKHWDRIDVLCGPCANPVLDTNIPIHGNVYLHTCPVSMWHFMQWAKKKVTELHAMHGYALVTSHAYPPFFQLRTAVYVQQTLGIPAVTEWHGIQSFTQCSAFIDYIGYMTITMFAHYSNAMQGVRAVSNSVSIALQSLGIEQSKIALLPAVYIDPTIWQPSTIPKKYDFVFCGRLDANKRLDRILHALCNLPDATLVVIGDGPLQNSLVQLTRSLQLESRVTFIGWLNTPNEVAHIIQSSYCLIMPSGFEGGPRVVVEALAVGVPVIATSVGLVPDVLIDGVNGYSTTGTITDIALCMKKAHHNQNLVDSTLYGAVQIAAKYNRETLLYDYQNWLTNNAIHYN